MASFNESHVRLEFNPEAFPEIRHMFGGMCAELGETIAERSNRLADAHNTGAGPSGTYDSQNFGGASRPRTYVRTADARGALDSALHATLVEATYSAKSGGGH